MSESDSRSARRGLIVAAIGVVFGDIGTSPLYALRECFNGDYALEATRSNVLGVLSLLVWSMTLVVSIKYLALILRADNRGEGGILALMALALQKSAASGRRRRVLLLVGMAGAALFFADGLITPAISVLSAIEGLSVAAPGFGDHQLPIAIAVIVGLFIVQKRGTERVATWFGPIMLVWFAVMALLGLMHIADDPHIFAAIDPRWAVDLAMRHGWHTLVIMGAVFLVMTGGEALYADMGHFGRRSIRIGWFSVVMPAILLNYFGQGALLLTDPGAAAHPFYGLAPKAIQLPLVVLATAATVIASQAVISGVFSVTRQAIQLGILPRADIVHTSESTIGQIYVPAANWAMLVGVICLLLTFGSSSEIASAYGIAVSLTMVLEVGLVFVLAATGWGWRWWSLLAVAALILFDLSYLAANSLKISHGGWFPLVLSFLLVMLMTTWTRGSRLVREQVRCQEMPIDLFLSSVTDVPRVSGTAVFLSRVAEGIPHSLLHNLKHNKILHERVVLMSLIVEEVPRILNDRVLEIENLGSGFYRIKAHFGFSEEFDVPRVLQRAAAKGMPFDMMDTTFFLGRETVIPTRGAGMTVWREHLFGWMWKSAARAMDSLKLPPNRVVELGTQVEI